MIRWSHSSHTTLEIVPGEDFDSQSPNLRSKLTNPPPRGQQVEKGNLNATKGLPGVNQRNTNDLCLCFFVLSCFPLFFFMVFSLDLCKGLTSANILQMFFQFTKILSLTVFSNLTPVDLCFRHHRGGFAFMSTNVDPIWTAGNQETIKQRAVKKTDLDWVVYK